MKIAIDIDEVVFEFSRRFMDFAEDKGVKRIPYEELSSFEIFKDLKISKERFFELLGEYNRSEYCRDVRFVEGAKEGVDFLNKEFDICFITARPKKINKETRTSIFENFSILGDRVFFSGNSLAGGISKCEICKRLGIGIIIEDSGEDSLRYAGNGINVLLLDKPWNQGFKHEKILRCKDWNEVLERVEVLKNE